MWTVQPRRQFDSHVAQDFGVSGPRAPGAGTDFGLGYTVGFLICFGLVIAVVLKFKNSRREYVAVVRGLG
jgi:hypothetical protein